MPIYEFDCQSCGNEFDKLVRTMSAVSTVTCPSCESSHIKKKMSLFSSRVGNHSSASATNAAASCSPGGL